MEILRNNSQRTTEEYIYILLAQTIVHLPHIYSGTMSENLIIVDVYIYDLLLLGVYTRGSFCEMFNR